MKRAIIESWCVFLFANHTRKGFTVLYNPIFRVPEYSELPVRARVRADEITAAQ